MREAIWIAIAFALLAVESPLLGHFDSQFFVPDVALLVALYAGSRTELGPAILVGFAAGLLKDGLAMAAPVGIYTEINVLAVLAARVLARHVDLQSPLPLMATAAGASLGATALFLLLESIFHRSFDAFGDILKMALPLALITMLVAPPLFAILRRATARFEHQHRGLLPIRQKTR